MDDKKYEEIGSNYRFFLGWRHAVFAGDLVILYGVLSLTYSIFKEEPRLAWIVPMLGSPIGLLLRIIDVRTRSLFKAAITAGMKLEDGKGGLFTELFPLMSKKGDPQLKPTHSLALDILLIGSSVILFLLSLVLLDMAIISLAHSCLAFIIHK